MCLHLCGGGFCSSVTKHCRRTKPRKLCFASAGILELRWLRTEKMCWVRVPVKMFGLGGIFFPFVIERYLSNDQCCDTSSGNEDRYEI